MSDYLVQPAGPNERIIIVGGPQTGKSTLTRQLQNDGIPVYSGNPRSMVPEPQEGVTYLPEGLEWSEGSQFVADNWLSAEGPWIMEGQIMARALRKHSGDSPADRIIVLADYHPLAEVSAGQAAMHKGVMTVWNEIAPRFADITEYPALKPIPGPQWKQTRFQQRLQERKAAREQSLATRRRSAKLNP